MSSGSDRSRTSSVRQVFVRVLVLGVILPAGLIWGVGQWTAQSAVTALWDALSRRISDVTMERTLHYLATGETALAYNDAAIRQQRADPSDREDMLEFLQGGLRANPHVTWYSFAGADGAYLSAYRKTDGSIRLTWREQEGEAARYRDFAVADDGTRTALPEQVKPYDPRTRAWFETAVSTDGPVWSRPFLFASGPPGFILSKAVRTEQGELIGVWGIEYEMSYVSEFLAKLEVGRNGRVYLVTQTGEVIGHPLAGGRTGELDGWIVREEDGKKVIATVEDHPDPWLRTAYRECVIQGRGEHHFAFDLDGETYLTASEPFPASTGLPWGILVVVPEDDILGDIHRNTLIAALLAALIAGLVLTVGVFYASRRLSRPLADIAHDLDRMARLETEGSPRMTSSRLTEVDGMVEARNRMRGGLRSFMKYVPAQLVRDLFADGAEARLGGETRTLTILFSDVANFTAVSEDLRDPERLVDALAEYFRVMSATIAGCNGTVDKYIGDAVMAFWGAPQELADHAVQACRAAWTCQRNLESLRREWELEGKPPFHTRIGVNTGPAVVGNIGWAERMNYTAMGDAVNVASRLEGVCSLYGIEIAISKGTYDTVKETFVARPVDFVSVKGRDEPLVVYELLGPRDDVPDEVLDFAARTSHAFDLYRNQKFTEAKRIFEEALEQRPADVGCRELAERCAEYLATPPLDDWTGAVRLSRKR